MGILIVLIQIKAYDAVFYLKTAADGAEGFYTIGNNKARFESPKKAQEIDLKTIHAWTGHSHLRVIDNSTGFDIKINRLMSEIYAFLGIPVPLEIESKFLVKRPDIEQLVEQHNAEKTDIIQTYLRTEDKDEEKRIRQRGKDDDCSFFLTKKKKHR